MAGVRAQRRRPALTVGGLSALALLLLPACQEEPTPTVALFCLDGATPDVIDELRARGELPNLDRMIRRGAYGPLQSLREPRLLRESPQRGFWSPIVWTSIATGKVPAKHGIRDFLMPVPGTSKVWIGTESGPPHAQIELPELHGVFPLTLHLRLRSHTPDGEQEARVELNGVPVGTIRVPVQYEDFALELTKEHLRPARNVLELFFSRQSRPADHGGSDDLRRLAAELLSVRVVDARGEILDDLDPALDRERLGHGFHFPRANVVEAQSAHWTALPLWRILGDRGIASGVVGYWATWPAYPVNGFLVSSRMGMRGRRDGTTTRLTWPEPLAESLGALYPKSQEAEELVAEAGFSSCDGPILDDEHVLRKILEQDEFYFRIARELWPTIDEGLRAVYFESIDVAGHHFLHWREGAALPSGCSEDARRVVDRTYIAADRRIGELVSTLPPTATVLIVSDHGMIAGGDRGFHAPEGVFIASGPGIRRAHAFQGAHVLDVTPTILHLFGEPVPLDMDGKVLASIFDSEWLESHGPRYADVDTSWSPERELDTMTEGQEEVLERLRAIGYIE
jgi:predicted AlkP superfamily phosphohydrolase/phosphomutase